jgi:hypothetical protein
MALITTSDFINKWELSTGMYSTAKLTEYISRYEPQYLRQLFGVDLYNSFVSDLSANIPQSPNFKLVFDPLYVDENLAFMIESRGVLDMLKGFIYFEYAKDLMNQQTPFGNVQQTAENSVVVNTLQTMMYARYNESITSYQSIRSYMLSNSTMKVGQAVTIALDNTGTSYTTSTDVATSGGNGSGCSVDITETGGVIDSVTLNNVGDSYQVGDILTIVGGDNNATINLSYVGKGIYAKYNGMDKGTAYWI